MQITSNFDAGNIIVVSQQKNTTQLKIRKDTNSDFFQWFNFKITDAIIGNTYNFCIENANESAFPDGWDNYKTNASYDAKNWFRLQNTEYKNGKLYFSITPTQTEVSFAYFTPFTYQQHLDLVATASKSPLCTTTILGETINKKTIELLQFGTPSPDKKNIWIIARQHPGESMAEWFMNGIVNRFVLKDTTIDKLLTNCCFYLIPNMNIDGCIAGNLRVNTLGINYNRVWENPNKNTEPEVFYCKQKMQETGLDFLLDVHGDEAIPYSFVTSLQGIPSITDKILSEEIRFKNEWMAVTPEFQDTYKYKNSLPNQANLGVCSKQIGELFKTLSFTLEMPFKDNDAIPDLEKGWSAERSEVLGASFLTALEKFLSGKN
ncbi:M14-type cytosolic carboxypeptidase [Tenacibaculum pacificus]|uniref:M14 family metallopeptidase n=1 Tax=Tenacibaculum pacificus TaxID=3018314 RepID=UPI0022F380C1|nr:M14-type cytosolic carboxypeptidase [Tenacibaculum pacificus]WBX74180.1 M14-type cytosolic carboxypeptidase [Tenacibaculum pacificus]